ncbi:MAG TPA: hypothetical protein DIC36_09800 [Gammaproteobacteria bacterium]|nr:hypothetical protein [Gammaproteobacteria bacterium]
MQLGSIRHLFYAVLLSVALHAMGFALTGYVLTLTGKPEAPEPKNEILTEMLLPPEKTIRAKATQPASAPPPTPVDDQAIQLHLDNPLTTVVTAHQPASQAAPPAPTAEQWAFASKYTLKNSKGYRYTWGHQVRSMMGTAVEGPNQGAVRFRVEIAPDGTLVKLETLWTTSAVAERLARQAIHNLPSLPPTPTGKPLIFERTIAFSAFAADSPPVYKDDCLPDPPAFESPYTWDGKSPWVWVKPKPVEKPDPQAMEECLKQLPQESIDAELGRSQEILERWGTGESGR